MATDDPKKWKREQTCKFWWQSGRCRKMDECPFQHDQTEQQWIKHKTAEMNTNLRTIREEEQKKLDKTLKEVQEKTDELNALKAIAQKLLFQDNK